MRSAKRLRGWMSASMWSTAFQPDEALAKLRSLGTCENNLAIIAVEIN